MGCDIHAFIEYQEGDYWVQFADVKIGRWYTLFGHLAGVRNDFAPVVEPRGVPRDLSMDVEWEFNDWGSDAHHASWLTLDELEQVALLSTNQEFAATIAAMNSLEASGNTTRLVIWFDN